ncbi:MAG: penicillin-binding protein 1C [Chthoniobacteraceae bacterium]|jgi:penicillin-binding protein 1C
MLRLGRIIIGFAALLIVGVALWAWSVPVPAALDKALDGTLNLQDFRGRDLAIIPNSDARAQIPVSLAEMGEYLPRITVALEDKRFETHSGIDIEALCAAVWRNVRVGRIVSGGSTITEQLVKIASGREGRSWMGKLREAVAAWKLERQWDKARILAAYLNRVSYGNRRLGPEAAARAYFGKSAAHLTLAEAIYLAGLPQSPTRFNPWTHPKEAAARYRRVLVQLAVTGIITPAQRDLLANPPAILHVEPPHLAPHFVDAVLRENPGLRGTVRTTLDLDLQRTAEWAVRAHLASLNRADVTQAAMVIVENSTGAVRALVGSSDYALCEVNGALRPRSCGSTLKPFIYLEAIDRRIVTAATLLPDTPDAIRDAYADYDPQDFTRRCLGPVRMREALACSLNVPAVVTLSRIGAREAFFSLRQWGFNFERTFDDYGAGFILGNAGIRLVDLAAAYAGLERGGLALPARYIEARMAPVTRMSSPEAAGIITDILCDNEARRRAFGPASPLALKQRVAAKTGTSSGFRDAWTVGFDKEHTVAVWAGNFDGHPLGGLLAIRAAAPLWAATMNLLLRTDHGLPPAPGTLVRRDVCSLTGLLPCAHSPGTVPELFLKGTEPLVDASGYFATDGTMLLPPEYAAWCATADNTIGARVRPEPRILSPYPGAHYVIDAVLPRDQQMVELTSTLPGGVRWFVNGREVEPQRDGRVFWKLEEGSFLIRAVSAMADLSEGIAVE